MVPPQGVAFRNVGKHRVSHIGETKNDDVHKDACQRRRRDGHRIRPDRRADRSGRDYRADLDRRQPQQDLHQRRRQPQQDELIAAPEFRRREC